ncbi:FAD:protein FMN transferase [Teredinibacter sp. KSP-S5-2]|uniref:FAD:protein FMN transferase n=1 Tax=Teredinibacter sp. KSP-S5-2 TaxID=3034506 RepID=UPI0029345543|nr:FAD:protein FMN transferase [Teredinibacter sp. KSP-S5-2]WNO10818.1 FAD:protein FMN transferase [Teredinibacter sp. KSP-S5-2]
MDVSEEPQLIHKKTYYLAAFSAMASPCELLIETDDIQRAQAIQNICYQEVKRIEHKFSRYIKGNLCDRLNTAMGETVDIDEECYKLLTFADACYTLSSGMFDITSGVLRRIWKFDGSDKIPSQSQIDQILPDIGWEKIRYSNQSLTMKKDMEIDFGGIGKEYAVSRTAQLCREQFPETSVLVNLGGDIEISVPRKNNEVWTVGVEDPTASDKTQGVLTIREGALATSGDSKRFLRRGKKKYSHILNPKTGWPVPGAPSSVTVAAQVCIQAGCLATIALLNGKNAEAFLQQQEVKYWCSAT